MPPERERLDDNVSDTKAGTEESTLLGEIRASSESVGVATIGPLGPATQGSSPRRITQVAVALVLLSTARRPHRRLPWKPMIALLDYTLGFDWLSRS